MLRRYVRTTAAAVATIGIASSLGAASALAAGSQATAAGSAAGSLLYSKQGTIYLAHADGSGPVVVKKGGYYWPSMDDAGIIAAETQDAAAPDGTSGYTIYRFAQDGTKLPGQVATPSAYSSVACPTYPSYHLSVSPDGTKVAYDYSDCNGEHVTWTRSSGTLNLHDQSDYFAPAWLSSSQLAISHFGVTFSSSQAELGLLGTDGSTAGWSAHLADSWATAYHATATRNGKKVALIEDDAADYFGTPQHVRIVLGTAGGPGQPITKQCTVSLRAKQYADWYGADYANLSFSPNGNVLAWDSASGIWRGDTKTLTGCTSSTVNPQLWIKRAINPSFSPAADTR